MDRKKWIAPAVLVLALAGGSISGCMTTNDGEQGIEALEGMTDLEFNKWKLYVSLGTKIGANRLLAEGLVTEEELDIAATAIETARDQSVVPGSTAIITPALQEAGLTNDEVQLLLLIVEQELMSRGALDWIDPETGLVAFSPRTKELLTAVADALRAAETITDNEVEKGRLIEVEVGGTFVTRMIYDGVKQ